MGNYVQTDTKISLDGKSIITTKTTLNTLVEISESPNPSYTPPPAVIAPQIPTNALIYANIEKSTAWKGTKDSATSGTAADISSSTSLISTVSPEERLFHFQNKLKGAGFRWSNSFAKNADSMNFCYDIQVQADDWTQVMNLELDLTQVMPNGQACFLCLQSASGSQTWEYTTTPSGKTHWNASNIPSDHRLWPKNTWKRIRLFSHRDSTGTVFYDGVEVDGVYTPFTGASGLSALSLGWAPKTLLLNFQIEGANSSGAVNLSVKNLNIYAW